MLKKKKKPKDYLNYLTACSKICCEACVKISFLEYENYGFDHKKYLQIIENLNVSYLPKK